MFRSVSKEWAHKKKKKMLRVDKTIVYVRNDSFANFLR